MTLDRLLEIWTSPYGEDKVPDYSQIYPHYHPNCRFHDSIQHFDGLDIFKEMCERLEERCNEIRMEVHSAGQNGNVFFVEWTMTMSFRGTPMTPLNGATRLNVDDDGLVQISALKKENIDKAMEMVKAIVAEPEAGVTYEGKITKITDFGAFVEIMPGTEGLLHISEISHKRINKVTDVLKEGEMIKVKCLDVAPNGRIRLSRKALVERK